MPKEIDLNRVPAEALAKMQAKAANKPEPINNTDLVAQFRHIGGTVLHMRPKKTMGTKRQTRGVTMAFIEKGGRMEIASALTHRADSFCKKNGTKTAIEHFLAGKTITLPIQPGRTPVGQLKIALGYIV